MCASATTSLYRTPSHAATAAMTSSCWRVGALVKRLAWPVVKIIAVSTEVPGYNTACSAAAVFHPTFPRPCSADVACGPLPLLPLGDALQARTLLSW